MQKLGNLKVDFSALERVAARFPSEQKFSLETPSEGWRHIATALRTGIEIDIEDLEVDDGLLVYKGHHVILYIKDHGMRIGNALGDASKGNRFHVAECETLEKMRTQGRFDRYVVSQGTSGLFQIAGIDPTTRAELKGEAKLQVCLHCLKRLNYRSSLLGNQSQRREIRDQFSLLEFFETYSTRFATLPSDFSAKDNSALYSADWREISSSIRSRAEFRCAECSVSLSAHQGLLHVHHVNGVKNDNRSQNLRPLCKDCHRKQPAHGHIFVKAEEMATLQRLRREQNLLRPTWESALKHADTAIRPALEIARHCGWEAPAVGHSELAKTQSDVQFDAAWPEKKLGISSTVKPADLPAWQITRPGKFLRELAEKI
ncbi:HNH endonuclease [Achromobacter piechaudii]|uniref:HNH nuclease domain-containing protein n=1 Tax=Achromobacter piechaudii TaxID=72556 RepID=A0A6S7CF22_9BURK|nr:HNH endonuclease [Achromobacter piechaudii]CAB3834331.1 hypothetical protein LMG1861_00942 [Achromobacter piechaudii]